MRQTFSVAFYCRESKVTKKNGKAAIEMSIIINGKRAFLSLPMKVTPSEFSTLYNQKRSNPVKELCAMYEEMVNDSVRLLIENKKPLTPSSVKDVMTNGISTTFLLSDLFKQHLELLAEKTRADLSLGTYRKYELAFQVFQSIVGDKEAKDVTNSDVEKYIAHLRANNKPSTVRGYSLKIKSAYIQAIRDAKLTHNPFDGVKIKNPKEKYEIITPEEYERIRDIRFDIPRLEKVRQLFVLGCNCGLSYCDLMSLSIDDVQYKDGIAFISKRRQKTNVAFTAVVLEDGIDILNNLNNIKLSNQKCNSYLKTIADHCGITKNLTFHQSRHHYITTLLRRNVNVGIVKECAGHSSISMTNKYVHLIEDDVINAFRGGN